MPGKFQFESIHLATLLSTYSHIVSRRKEHSRFLNLLVLTLSAHVLSAQKLLINKRKKVVSVNEAYLEW
jgi:hypothetical protein